jgi:hypothetical protein
MTLPAAALAAVLPAALGAVPPADKGFTAVRDAGGVAVKAPGGRPVLRYVTVRPKDSNLSVESACYFHPVQTPKGVVLTDVAPDDHRHHRGVFLAWVEMHGKKGADFWGWGQHAPKDGRVIVNRRADIVAEQPGRAELRCRNDWMAEGERVLEEDLRTDVTQRDGCHVIDLTYTLTPDADVKLACWAFSGFCYRGRKDGKVVATGPQGKVDLPDPRHGKPESDWPDAAWYDFTLHLPDGEVAGLAVLNHPKNPPSRWHNHRTARMLNPCIVAPGVVVLTANKPLVLRYRLVAHDGPAPAEVLRKLAREWEAQ